MECTVLVNLELQHLLLLTSRCSFKASNTSKSPGAYIESVGIHIDSITSLLGRTKCITIRFGNLPIIMLRSHVIQIRFELSDAN